MIHLLSWHVHIVFDTLVICLHNLHLVRFTRIINNPAASTVTVARSLVSPLAALVLFWLGRWEQSGEGGGDIFKSRYPLNAPSGTLTCQPSPLPKKQTVCDKKETRKTQKLPTCQFDIGVRAWAPKCTVHLNKYSCARALISCDLRPARGSKRQTGWEKDSTLQGRAAVPLALHDSCI